MQKDLLKKKQNASNLQRVTTVLHETKLAQIPLSALSAPGSTENYREIEIVFSLLYPKLPPQFNAIL